MQQVFRMRDAEGNDYDVPANEMGEFSQQVKGATRMNFHKGADGQEYDVPDADMGDFRSQVKDATEYRTFRMANGEDRTMTIPEVSKFLRSKEYRESEDYEAPDQKSVGWAALKGALGGAAEGAWEGAKATGAKIGMIPSEIGGGVLKAAGNLVNLMGNGKNAVGNALVDAGNTAIGYWDEKLVPSTAERLGYEDLGTKTGDFFGNTAAMAAKFAPAMSAELGIGATVYLESLLATDGVNAYADTFDKAKESGMGDVGANALGMASGLVNYFGGKYLMKAGGATNNIKNPLIRELATAAAGGSVMGVQGAANKGIDNAAQYKPLEEGALGAAAEGFAEGAAFHGANMIPHLPRTIRQTKAHYTAARDWIVEAAKSDPAMLSDLMDQPALDEVIKARREGKDVSRKMGDEIFLPSNMSVEQRNGVVDSIIKYRDGEAKKAADAETKAGEEKAAKEETRAKTREEDFKAAESAEAERMATGREEAKAESELTEEGKAIEDRENRRAEEMRANAEAREEAEMGERIERQGEEMRRNAEARKAEEAKYKEAKEEEPATKTEVVSQEEMPAEAKEEPAQEPPKNAEESAPKEAATTEAKEEAKPVEGKEGGNNADAVQIPKTKEELASAIKAEIEKARERGEREAKIGELDKIEKFADEQMESGEWNEKDVHNFYKDVLDDIYSVAPDKNFKPIEYFREANEGLAGDASAKPSAEVKPQADEPAPTAEPVQAEPAPKSKGKKGDVSALRASAEARRTAAAEKLAKQDTADLQDERASLLDRIENGVTREGDEGESVTTKLTASQQKTLRKQVDAIEAELNRRGAPLAQVRARSNAELTDVTRPENADFANWVREKRVTATDAAREQFDREQAKGAAKVVKRWMKGMKTVFHDDPAFRPGSANGDVRLFNSPSGEVIGWYDGVKKEVHLLPGANAETVQHEIGWHATYDHAQELARNGDRRLLDKLDEYANTAPASLVNEVSRRYARLGITEHAVLMDEVGAARFTEEHILKMKDEVARRDALKWYGKAWEAAKDAYKSALSKMGFNKVSIDAIDAMNAKDAVDYIAKMQVEGKTLAKVERSMTDPNLAETAKEKYVRKMKDTDSVMDFVDRATGGVFKLHREARLSHGEKQKGTNRANQAVEEIADLVKRSGVKLWEVDDYMKLKGARDTNTRLWLRDGVRDGSGISSHEADRRLAQYNADPNRLADIEAVAKKLWDLQKEGMRLRQQAGLISAQTLADMEANEPYHVPRHSRFDADGEFMGYETNADLANGEWHTAGGRVNESYNSVGWILQEYLDAASRAADNKVRSRLAAAIASTGGRLGKIVRINDANKAQYSEVRKVGGKLTDGNANSVIFKSNGELYAIELAGTRGELVARTLTGRGKQQMPSFVKKAMRVWASTATELSPTFAFRNFLADTADILHNNIGDHGFIDGWRRNASHLANVARIGKDLFNYARTGQTANRTINDYIRDGGLIGGIAREGYTDGIEGVQKMVDKMAKSGKVTPKSLWEAYKYGVGVINTTSELVNRLADYKTQTSRGMNGRDAAEHARKLTVDFNEQGEWTGISNTLYMFSNSTMGAAFRQVSAMARHPAQLTASLLGVGCAEALLEAFCNMDEDKAEAEGRTTTKDVNEYTRANSFYLRFGDKVVRTPFHAGPLSLVKYAGNCATRVLLGKMKPGDAGYEVGKEAAGILTHFMGLGDAGPNMTQTLAPTIVQPFIQYWQNQDYAGRPIVRQTIDQSRPLSSNGREGTGSVYKWMAEKWNALGGGSSSRKGKLSIFGHDLISTDVAPEHIKLAVEALGKNLLRDVVGVYDAGAMAVGAEKFDTRKTPVLRDVLRQQGGNDNRYFEAVQRFKDDKFDLSHRESWGAGEKRKYYDERPWLRKNGMSNTAVERLVNGYSSGGSHVNGIDDLRRMEKGEFRVKTANGVSWKKREISEEQAEKYRNLRLRKQAKVIKLMEREGK